MPRTIKQPFKIGDNVRLRHGASDEVLTIAWISKGAVSREEQLIATQANSYSNPCSEASLYEEASM